MLNVDLNYTERRLLFERDDGGFLRNSKNLFNLFILHDPLINKIILKMQEYIIRDTVPESVHQCKLQNYEDLVNYGDLLTATISKTG